MGSRAFVSRIDLSILHRISTGGIVLPFVSEARNLGVVMSSNLYWLSHVLSISRKVHFSLHRLKYHRNILSRELGTTLVTSLIFPILDYCCLVYNDLTEEQNTKLQQLTNCGIRFIFDLRRDVHISVKAAKMINTSRYLVKKARELKKKDIAVTPCKNYSKRNHPFNYFLIVEISYVLF